MFIIVPAQVGCDIGIEIKTQFICFRDSLPGKMIAKGTHTRAFFLCIHSSSCSYLYFYLMYRFDIILCLMLFWTASPVSDQMPGVYTREGPPNIVIIYADDLGIGDVSCYGRGTLRTPNIDRLAQRGLLFTNGYATSATCTPSRYALLTGTYPWRNQEARILAGNAPLIIDTSIQTLPKTLQLAGFRTGVFGKWHLGLGNEGMNWNGEIRPGPQEVGFDESFILASTNDRVPTVFVENGKVSRLKAEDPLFVSYKENFPGEPTGKENPELLKLHPSHGHDMSVHNGISRIGYMKGGSSARWVDEQIADTVVARARAFVTQNREKPFFLYLGLHQPHVPRTPAPRFVGRSGQGPRGDAILEADWMVGQVLELLSMLQLEEKTLVIFSSDNGPVLDDGYQDNAVESLGGHDPFAQLRGGKYSLFDAGAHVPFLVSWPGTISPGISASLVCQIDLLASLAALAGQPIAGTDSKNLLPALMGSGDGRESLVLEASGRTCLRAGDWVLIPPYEGLARTNQWVNIETGISGALQLYNLALDPAQKRNLAQVYPDIAEDLYALYQEKSR